MSVVQAVGTPRPPITQERGTIEAVQPEGLVLRRPDGTALAVAVGPATRVLLRGAPAAAADLVPGLTALVRHRGTEPALSVRAFGKAPG